MRIFTHLYQKMLAWARHPAAPYYLYVLSFAESSVFPIPTDVMLAPMALAKPNCAWRYALFTTIASVLGGLFGYLIGAWAFTFVHPLLIKFGYAASYAKIQNWFNVWGFWVILFACFAPIPYKLFTIAAGATHIALLPFILGSALGRGIRYFLVTGVILWGGERLEKLVARYIERIGWMAVILLLFIYWFWYHHPHYL